MFQLEFPLLCTKGIQLALFRTYAIPTISSLLYRTRLLSSSNTIARRYAETWVLFNEFALREWGSTPWLQATARTRAIHVNYRRLGKVLEEDMLYTLAAVATQPVELIQTWGWRKLTKPEIWAIGTLYQGIAETLDIDYKALFSQTKTEDSENLFLKFRQDERSTSASGKGIRDCFTGLDFYHALRA